MKVLHATSNLLLWTLTLSTKEWFDMARLFMTLGFLFLALGLFWGFGEKLGLGRLPGDFAWKRENYSIHMPLATCLLISLGLSLISWLWQYLRR